MKIFETYDKFFQKVMRQIVFIIQMIIWVAVFYILWLFLGWLFTKMIKINISLNDFILLITAAFIFVYAKETQELRNQTKRQAEATERMVEHQLMPAIDVNMIYDNNVKKTYFWFSNDSKLPGMVHLEFQKNKEERKEVYKPLRIPPKRSMKTATTFEFSPIEGDEMIIYVLVKLALTKSNFETKFEKSYTFTQNQWNENSWSFPDPPFLVKSQRIN